MHASMALSKDGNANKQMSDRIDSIESKLDNFHETLSSLEQTVKTQRDKDMHIASLEAKLDLIMTHFSIQAPSSQ